MTNQKNTTMSYSDFDPTMKIATNEKDFIKKMTKKRKKTNNPKNVNMQKNAAATGSDLHIGVVTYNR